jgi:group I intron endonuclease
MAYIYRILNKISKKMYIGITTYKDVRKRWNQHIQTASINKGCPALREAFHKYGIENFEFSVILICFDEDRFKYEIEYIKKYNSVAPNGYNLTDGGQGGGGFKGKKHTEEVKNRIKTTLKQKYIDNPELKKVLSERNTILMKQTDIINKIKQGIYNSKLNKIKQNIHNSKINITSCVRKKILSDETKNKISEGLKTYYSENNKQPHSNPNCTRICQFTNDNIFLNEYYSISNASFVTKVPRKAISLYIRGKVKIAGEFIWRYA